ncbi:nitric oxide-sensing protein NosP [Agarivorans sp. Z349TD_8]|uniref:nitric oxide-sensing protein NosP n=1 Tax=Agarivorans sp. Z349TD_8 TaxID=3421434 RepID=UPI003D7D2B8A
MKIKNVNLGQSQAVDAAVAAAEFYQAVKQPDMSLVLFFCSSQYDLERLSQEMNRWFRGIQVMGCTTAGEIGPVGLLQHSLVGVSFAADHFTVACGLLNDLQNFERNQGHQCVQSLLQQLKSKEPKFDAANSFAFMLIDGLSKQEEMVAHALQDALGEIVSLGGSAADDQRYSNTYVFFQGQFHVNSAVLMVVHTRLPFIVFTTHHFVGNTERLVVTKADTQSRRVIEINGFPAASEYARLVGVAEHQLNSAVFAASPMVVLIGTCEYVRSIQKVNSDGSLSFFGAIEEGVVFRIGESGHMLENVRHSLECMTEKLGSIQLVIVCDCILRRLEAVEKGINLLIAEQLDAHHAIGFNSYGEQYYGVHMNQTLTGIAIGSTSQNVENSQSW